MSQRFFVRRAQVLSVALLSSVLPMVPLVAGPTVAQTGSVVAQANDAVAQELLRLVNAERQRVNAPPLVLNSRLTSAAQRHAQDMANTRRLSHTGSDGSTMRSRIDATQYSWSTIGENVAMGQPTAAAVMAGWMNSPGHRQNILSPAFTELGIGTANGGGRPYWVQVFARPQGTAQRPSPPVATPGMPAPPVATPGTPAPPVSTDSTAIAQDLLRLVNAERQRVSALPLVLNSQLTSAAQRHAQDMATRRTLSHTGSDGSTMQSRVEAVGYPWRNLGENVAMGQPTAAAVMTAWMNSPGHRQNILNPAFTELGVGYAQGGSSPYWAQVFGRR